MTHALRVIHTDERPAPQEGVPQRLMSIMRIPDWMFSRPDHANESREAVTYECEVHGLIEPLAFANGYRRRECPCQWEQRQTEGMARYQATIRQVLGTERAERTYTWLGKDAEELGLEGKTFSTFDEHTQPEAYQVCSTYNPISNPSNLLLMGGYGTGKTHLVAAILNTLRAASVPCLFATAQNLFNVLYSPDFDAHQSIIVQAGSTPFLVLDDLDKLYIKPTKDPEQAGKYQKGILLDIIDRRYKRGLPTAITTNAEVSLSQWLNDAALDRLYERRILLRMNGKSYRRVLAEQHKNGG